MKNIKYLFIIGFTLLFTTGVALAQTNTGTILPPPQGGTTPDSYDSISKENLDMGMIKPIGAQEENKLPNNEIKEIRVLKAQVEAVKEEVKILRENAKEKMQELKEKIKTEKNKAKAKIKEEILLGREQALERFDTAIQRAEDLRIKVEKQVTKLESQGIVVKDELKNLSINAETKLNEARAKVVEINTILAKSTNQLSKEDKTKINSLTKETQQLIKDAHKMLNDEVFELKKLINPNIQTPQPSSEQTLPSNNNTNTTTN